LCRQHLRARARDRADLQRREHHRVPLRRLADQDEHAIDGRDSARAEHARPARGPFARPAERDVLPSHLAFAEARRERGRILRLDHVAREVEPRRRHRARTAMVVVLAATSFPSAYASPRQTVNRPPERTTRPCQSTRSPTAGSSRLILYSTVSTSTS